MRKFSRCYSLLLAVSFAVFVGGLSSGVLAAYDHEAGADQSHAGDDGEDYAGGAPPKGAPMAFKTDLAFWSLITFLVFIFVLKTFAWGPLMAGLDKRESKVAGDIAEAEAAHTKAKQMLAEHVAKLDKVQDEVKEIMAEARRDAEQTKNEIVTAAQKEAEATKERSLQEIERATDQALEKIFEEMADTIARATEQVLGRAIEMSDQDRFIEEALAQISEK